MCRLLLLLCPPVSGSKLSFYRHRNKLNVNKKREKEIKSENEKADQCCADTNIFHVRWRQMGLDASNVSGRQFNYGNINNLEP